MEIFIHAVLWNALVASGLALVPLVVGRYSRSPALVHSLWLVVLLKLVTPPVVEVRLSAFLGDPPAQSRRAADDHETLSSATSTAWQTPTSLSEQNDLRSSFGVTPDHGIRPSVSANQPDSSRPGRFLISTEVLPPWESFVLATMLS